MARTPKDPSPYLLGATAVAPEVVSQDFNLFYKPDKKPENKGLNQLVSSLASIVPTLATYSVTEELKVKAGDEAKAIKDFHENKDAFKSLVANGDIPASANPFYFNKMMELELREQSRLFESDFTEFLGKNKLHEKAGADGFNEAYELKLKEFYKNNELDNFDPRALNTGFFKNTSTFRNQMEQQHQAKRLKFIASKTADLATKNITGILIEAQFSKEKPEDALKTLKAETDYFIKDLKEDPSIANSYFVTGIENYINNANDENGLRYANKVLTQLETFKLGTGGFGGSNEGRATIQKLRSVLAKKELDLLQNQTQLKDEKDEAFNQNLSVDYWDDKQEQGVNFNFNNLLNKQSEDGTDFYSPKAKNQLIILNSAVNTSAKVTSSTFSAIQELELLQDTEPYKVKARATQLAQSGQLSQADWKTYYNFIDTYKKFNKPIFNNNILYNDVNALFKDKRLASTPVLASTLHLMKTDYKKSLYAWYLKNKDLDPDTLDVEMDKQIRVILGQVFSNSMVARRNKSIQKALEGFGIVIQGVTEEGEGN